jgi:hypothetical protein
LPASHLSREERKAVVATGRKALDAAGFTNEPLLVGTGGGSAQTTIELSNDAKEAGATHSIVIAPGESRSFDYGQVMERADPQDTLPLPWAATALRSSTFSKRSWTPRPCPS